MKLPRDVPTTAGRPPIDLDLEISEAILQIIKAGWDIASQWLSVNTDAYEVEMTERLRDGMRNARDNDTFSWSKNIRVLSGIEYRSRPDVLLPDGRIDIPIFVIELAFRFGDDPHAIIECKRIAGNDSQLCRQYVVAGIDRFQTGKYAGNHSTGFMVGYLIAGSASAAVDGINKYLNGKGRHDENLERSNLVSESWVWGSRHPRSDPPPIEIHHAFLKIGSAHC